MTMETTSVAVTGMKATAVETPAKTLSLTTVLRATASIRMLTLNARSRAINQRSRVMDSVTMATTIVDANMTAVTVVENQEKLTNSSTAKAAHV